MGLRFSLSLSLIFFSFAHSFSVVGPKLLAPAKLPLHVLAHTHKHFLSHRHCVCHWCFIIPFSVTTNDHYLLSQLGATLVISSHQTLASLFRGPFSFWEPFTNKKSILFSFLPKSFYCSFQFQFSVIGIRIK